MSCMLLVVPPPAGPLRCLLVRAALVPVDRGLTAAAAAKAAEAAAAAVGVNPGQHQA